MLDKLKPHEIKDELADVDNSKCAKACAEYRRINEKIVNRLYRFNSNDMNGHVKCVDKIRYLGKKQIAPKKIIDYMHKVRRTGNKAVHDDWRGVSPKDVAKKCDKMMKEIIYWVKNDYNGPGVDNEFWRDIIDVVKKIGIVAVFAGGILATMLTLFKGDKK